MGNMEQEYLALYRSGELEQRVRRLEARLSSCDICPRKCGVNRLANEHGYCHSGYSPAVSAYCAHHGEEPALSGYAGSGTIFFANCNMSCAFCQNFQISQRWQEQQSHDINCQTLAEQMIYLQDTLKCHNINFVSPSHFIPQIMRSVLLAIPQGLKIPLVYNTNSYDSLDTLRELEGVIGIYLPDIKYAANKWAKELSDTGNYVEYSRSAIKEMYRQVGNLAIDKDGIAQKGLIIRHLILPHGLAGSRETLTWLAREFSSDITLSIMSQYLPQNKASQIPLISRTISVSEYNEVTILLEELGLENGWLQNMDSPEAYVPDFNRKTHPFLPETK